MKSTIIGVDTRITRSCLENNCKIGKKVEILRSIIMGDV
jgi:NDP-sugar pyrophosphorylase family protein